MKRLIMLAILLTTGTCKPQIPFRVYIPQMLSDTKLVIVISEYGGDRDTLLHSTDEGQTWKMSITPESITDLQFPDSTTGYAMSVFQFLDLDPNRLYKTTDGGNTWTLLPGPWSRPGFVKFFSPDVGIFWIVSYNGLRIEGLNYVYRTSDGGVTWHPVTGDSLFMARNHMIVDFSFRDSLRGYASTIGVFMKTDDGGVTWSSTQSYYGPVANLDYCYYVPIQDTVLVAFGARRNPKSTSSEIYLSTNDGETWPLRPVAFSTKSNQRIYSVQFFNQYIGMAFSVTMDGVSGEGYQLYFPMRTTDGGRSWNVVSVPFKAWYGSFLRPSGIGYVADGATLYKTTDYGVTWLPMTITITGTEELPVPAAFALSQNHPNPVTAGQRVTTIPYSVATSSHVRLVVYDLMGRAVRTALDAARSPGAYSAQLDVTGLPPGVYYYTMYAGAEKATRMMIVR